MVAIRIPNREVPVAPEPVADFAGNRDSLAAQVGVERINVVAFSKADRQRDARMSASARVRRVLGVRAFKHDDGVADFHAPQKRLAIVVLELQILLKAQLL